MMNMKMKIAVLALAVMGIFSANAADDDLGLITFDGAVSGETCKMTTNNGIDAHNVTITMLTVSKSLVEGTTIAAGGVGSTTFDLKLTDCDPTLSKAHIAFTSQQFADLTTGTLKADPSVTGAAKNVNIALYNNGNGNTDQVIIGDPAGQGTQEVDLGTTHGGVFGFRAAYVPSADFDIANNPVAPGKVNANATFTLSYE